MEWVAFNLRQIEDPNQVRAFRGGESMKILILGGAGLMAEAIEKDLLEFDTNEVSRITLADINNEGLNKRIEELQSPKVIPALIDASEHDALVKLIKGHDVVVNTTPMTLPPARAALEAGVNFIGLVGVDLPRAAPGAPLNEIGIPTEEFKDQLDKEFKRAGITGIMGLGAMPGISNVLAEYFAKKLDTIESVEFSYVHLSLSKTKTIFPFNPPGIIGQYTREPVILREGKLVRVPPRSGREIILYPEPIGKREVFNVLHEEPIALYKSFRGRGLKNACTKAGWDLQLLNKLELLDSLGLLDFQPRKVGEVTVVPERVLESGLTFEKVTPHDYGCLRFVGRGEKDGQKLEYTAELFCGPYKELSGTQHRTGTSAAVGVRMLGRQQIKRKGAFTPEVGVDPEIFFKELARRELRVSYTVKHLVA